jgi:hypothetical protein
MGPSPESMGEQRQPNAGDANAIAIQFTAIIVSGATSDAELFECL